MEENALWNCDRKLRRNSRCPAGLWGLCGCSRKPSETHEEENEMSKWIRELSPKDKAFGDGWCRDMDRCYREGRKIVVLSRLINTSIGIVEHMAIRNADNTDISWSTKQRIKNELAGRKRTAIEVFPSEDRMIDAANMYHLWILPEGFDLPFGLHGDDVRTEPIERMLMKK